MDWRNRQSYLELVQSKNNGTETGTDAWDFIILILFLISLAILLLVSVSNRPKLAETLQNALKDPENKQWKRLFTIPVLVFAICVGTAACWQYNQLQYHTTADTVVFVVFVCLTVIFAVSKPLLVLKERRSKHTKTQRA